jgi:hypothetical protein
MFIRLFIQTENLDEAKNLFLDSMSTLSNKVQEYNFKKIEPYWKMEDLTVVEVEVILASKISEAERERFLSSISNKWIYFGNPLDEALSSKNTEGCTFLKNGIEMINIFFG